MRMLAGERHNVCAVGDEDQSIYSWRGADIRNILEFEQDFPEAKIVRLEQNYRSTQNILQGASAVVANNVRRKGKNLWTARQGGTKIGYYEAPDGENEALFAADHVAKYLREAAGRGETPRAAVLYRTNSQSRLFEEAMRRYGLKYKVVGGFSFYERSEIKDMISYLKVIHNPDDSISLLRVINTPTRGIGKSTIDTLEQLALETGMSLWGAVGRGDQTPVAAAARAGGAEELSAIDRRCARHAGRNLRGATHWNARSEERRALWGQPPKPALSGAEGAVQRDKSRRLPMPPSSTPRVWQSFDFGASAEEPTERERECRQRSEKQPPSRSDPARPQGRGSRFPAPTVTPPTSSNS